MHLFHTFLSLAVCCDWLFIADWLLRMFYRNTAVQIQRIDSVSISPVFSLYSETLGGLDTLRAYGLHELFRARFHYLTDYTTRAAKYLISATGWLRTRLLTLSLFLVAACVFFIVGMRFVRFLMVLHVIGSDIGGCCLVWFTV